jgi:gluconate 5-dehydrogenase
MIQKWFDLTGKTALVTGSSRGLGLVIARGLAAAGAKVMLNGVNRERLDAAVEAFRRDGLEAYACPFDVTDREQIEASLHDVKKTTGPVDILVNNAGIQRRGPLESFDPREWQAVIDTNLTGVFITTQCVVGDMIERKSGKIINICSLASEIARPTTGPYTAAKGGVKMLTRAMAVEWAAHNIQVNGIGPGYFLTDMTRTLAENEEFDRWIKGRTPARRWGDPEELTGPVVFLASDASSFINGQILYVDGGLLSLI